MKYISIGCFTEAIHLARISSLYLAILSIAPIDHLIIVRSQAMYRSHSNSVVYTVYCL